MSSYSDIEYIQVSLGVLKRFNRPLPFDIYVRRTEKNFSRIFLHGDPLDWQRIKSYEAKGIKHFYVTKEDYKKYTKYVEKLSDALFKNKGPERRDECMPLVAEMVNYTMFNLVVEQQIDQVVVESAAKIVTQCVEGINKNPKQLLSVLKYMANQPEIFKHSIMVAIISVMLAKRCGFETESNLSLIGMGAFLHDIGVGQLTFDPDDQEMLSPEERKEMWRHPGLGKQMVDGVNGVRTEVMQIILQHHEQPNGHGYPNGLKEGEIYPPAKIVGIVDTFCAMISKKSYREAFSPKRSYLSMKEDVGKFDRKFLRELGKLFHVD